MASQFAHAEGYGREARKGKAGNNTINRVIAEAMRDEGNHPHVKKPEPPIILYGSSPREAGEKAYSWAAQAKDSRGHRLRVDGLCLIAGVVSCPAELSDRWDGYKQDTLSWLKKEYGGHLVSVIEHTDEGYHHLHFFATPHEDERFEVIHDGIRAANMSDPERGSRKRTKDEKKLARKKARLAYIEAMRAWQDRFYKSVSRYYGLSRTGPRRKRKTREEYMADQAERRQLAELAQDLARRGQELEAREKRLLKREETARIKCEEADRRVEAIHEKAKQEVAEAKQKYEEATKNYRTFTDTKIKNAQKHLNEQAKQMKLEAEQAAKMELMARLKGLTPEEKKIVDKGLARKPSQGISR
jgi:hypothetical protein